MDKPPPVAINLRLPPELHQRLKQLAERDRRSLNAEIVHLLDQAANQAAERS